MAFITALPMSHCYSSAISQPSSRCLARPNPSLEKLLPRMSVTDSMRNAVKLAVVTSAVAFSTLLHPPAADAAIFHFRGERPMNIGVKYGRFLQVCPATPNCVSSSANVYDNHYVPAWTYNALPKEQRKTMPEAIADLKEVLATFPQATIVEEKSVDSEFGKGYYVYAEFESKLMGFIDDVEILFQPDQMNVEYRSASRLGEGDFDVNRKRIRDIRVKLQDKVS